MTGVLAMPGWIEIILRSFFILIVLFSLTKWLGKKQLSQLSFFEYVVGITIGSIAAEMSTGLEQSFMLGVLSLLVWTGVPYLVSIISIKNKKIRDFFEGKATIVIENGKILEENLEKEKYTIDDLLELLRKKNAFDLGGIEYAILEANGNLNVFLKKEYQPLTAKDIGLKLPPEKPPQTVILEGKIMDEQLGMTGYNREWLQAELDKLQVSLDNVYVGQINAFGELTVDIYDDNVQVPKPQGRPVLLATLKKCQADLELFSLQTDSPSAKKMYQKHAEHLNGIIQKVKYLLGNE